MGEIGQIVIEHEDRNEGKLLAKESVYLYTHWRGYELHAIAQEALARKQRWDDPEYLSRIIFDTMTKGATDRETGFGIGTGLHGDLGYPVVAISTARSEVRWLINRGVLNTFTFQAYIALPKAELDAQWKKACGEDD